MLPGTLELDDEAGTVGQPVHAQVAGTGHRVQLAAQRHRLVQRLPRRQQLAQPGLERAAELRHRPLEQALRREPQQGARVGAGLPHAEIALAQHQQGPVRLHRAREVDELPLAVGEVRLAERRAVAHGGWIS